MGIKVLIADDLKFIKLALRGLLENAGFRVVGEASNGEEAVELYQEKRPDVVLMDITMPRKDGLEALTEICRFDPQAKVIMLMALDQKLAAARAIHIGAKDFLVKPVSPDQLIAALQKALG